MVIVFNGLGMVQKKKKYSYKKYIINSNNILIFINVFISMTIINIY